MARLLCPFGYPDDYGRRSTSTFTQPDGTKVTLSGRATVEIKRGICDAPDLCKKKECPFYDRSREATSLFIKLTGQEHTLEGLIHKKANENLDREIYETMLQVYGISPKPDQGVT